MGDLRDAFKKAGLIDDKTAKRLEHEQRIERKELGRTGLDEQRRQQELERQQREEQKKAEATAAQQKHDAGLKAGARWKKLVHELHEQGTRGTSGPRRFHYQEPDGHLPFVQVDDETGRRLEAGELAIVRLPGSEGTADATALVPRALAAELHTFAPERILHVAGAGR